MGPLKLILLESPLERVPREIWGHPEVVASAKRYGVKPGDMLLDKSLHYHAMARLPEKWRRGRPDIVHVSLLTILDTPLAVKGLIEVYVHVYSGRVYKVEADTRLPKSYERFRGLVAQLLARGRVPGEGRPLIYEAYESLGEFAEGHGGLILLWEKGEPASPEHVAVRALYTGIPVGVGAFPRGDFKESTLAYSRERYSILGGSPLKAWGAAGRVIYAAERVLGYA